MQTLLIATEADEGMGHVVPWTGFVAQAIEQGYQVHMAAPDVGMLNQHVGEKFPIHLWSSPRLKSQMRMQKSAQPPVRSWPELLVSLGYAESSALQGAVKAWRSVLSQIRPTVILADYAPALILAAKTLDIPLLEVGGGFCIPPLTPSLQSFPGIKNHDAVAVGRADAKLTSAFNECLALFGQLRISTFGDTGSWPASRVIKSPPELDPYGYRSDVLYAGLLPPFVEAKKVNDSTLWPPVVGYLKGDTPGLDALLDEMSRARIEALVYVTGKQGQSRKGTVTTTGNPIPLSEALDHSSIYLSNGGLSGVGQALQKNCWPVVVPQQAEQVATAHNLIRRKWGAIWLPDLKYTIPQLTKEVFAMHPRHLPAMLQTQGESIFFKVIHALA